MVELLPQLHRHAVETARGTCSVLLQIDPRGGLLHPTSAFGLDWMPTDAWLADPAGARTVELVFRLEQPLVVSDLKTRLPNVAERLGTPAAALVPLHRFQERVGLLVIGLSDGGAPADFSEEVSAVGDAFVLALDRARTYGESDLQRELRALLQAFSRTVSSALKLTAGLDTFCYGATRLFAADRTSVWLHDRRARTLVLEASSDASYVAGGASVSTADAVAPAAIALRRERAEIAPGRPDDPGSPTALVTVPLKGRRRALGTLILEGVRIDPGAEADLLDRADEVGRQLSSAIENVLLLEDVLRSRRELENTFNSIADLVAVCDRGRRLVHVNRAFADRLGVAREDLLDRQLEEFIGPDTQRLVSELDASLSAAPGAANVVTQEVEDPVLKGTFSVTLTSLMSQDRGPIGSVMVARDTTPQARLEAERTELRDRLAQSEKLAALGQFVAGIAHELNNPLQGVLGHLELLRTTGAFPMALRRDVQVIYREADRAAKIVRNLLVFAGSRKIIRRRLSVNAVLSRALALRASACRAAGIEVVRHYDEGLPRVLGDPLLLQQAFLNIVMNAEQAIGGAGSRRIEARTRLSPANGMVLVEIRDTGGGIPNEVLTRVFEPFYTTKEVGKGTGLGLAIVYGIIQEHGGHIRAGNHPDGGAVFTVELPVERAPGRGAAVEDQTQRRLKS